MPDLPRTAVRSPGTAREGRRIVSSDQPIGGARDDHELVQPTGNDIATIEKPPPGVTSALGSERSAPFGMTEKIPPDRRADRTGMECSRNKKNAVLGNGDGRRRGRPPRNERSLPRRPWDRPHGTKQWRPCLARREPKPRGPRSICGRFPSARARTCPFSTRNPRTLRRVKAGEPADERKACPCCRIATRRPSLSREGGAKIGAGHPETGDRRSPIIRTCR